MYQMRLHRKLLAIHTMLAVPVEMELQQPEGVPTQANTAARLVHSFESVTIVEDRQWRFLVLEEQGRPSVPFSARDIHGGLLQARRTGSSPIRPTEQVIKIGRQD